jgi:nicotinamide phosphoribosyltransferase
MPAFSIPASEHSTMTSWTEPLEVKAFENMLDQFPTGLVACVSDSFDIIRACKDHWGNTLRDKILNRDGRLVIRPDSGDPIQTLKKIFNILWDKFGGTINDKGFKVIDPHVRVIQGDGVNYESIVDIMKMMVDEGFSVENIAFGMGGALLQKVDRDTQNFAIKCSSITINGVEIDVRKNPIEINENGDSVSSFKKSKSGRLKLVNGLTVESSIDEVGDELVEVFKDGVITKEWTFEEIKEKSTIK